MDEQFTPEVEDVEAHGLKEIAAGIVAAGAVGSGVVGVAHVTTTTPGMRPPAIVEQARGDADQLTRDASTAANTLAGDATVLVDHAGSAGLKAANETARGAISTIDATRDAVDGLVERTLPNIDRTLADTSAKAMGAANTVLVTGQTAAATATSTAKHGVDSAYATSMTVLSTVQDMANHWVVNVGVLGASASAEGSVTHPGGTVTLTDDAGGVVATADIHDGKATLSFDTPATGGTLHLNYPGDGLWGPTQHVFDLITPVL